MSKQNIIDYSNTVIYKIFCKDPTITDVYVGHTTNFQNRLLQHKTICNKVLNNTLKVYEFIREHGGWDNWDMVEIAKYNCKDRSEATLKEHEHFVSTNSTLNTNFPVSILVENDTFACESCDFKCNKKFNYETHISTHKHQLRTGITKKQAEQKIFHCECSKSYKHQSSLWNHRKTCDFKSVQTNNFNSSQTSQEELVSLLTQAMKEVFDEQTTGLCKILSTLKNNKT